MNKFFEKLFNFVYEYLFFLKGKEYSSTPASTDLIFFQSFDLKINVWSCFHITGNINLNCKEFTNNNGMHKLQSLVPVIATVKSWALLIASVGESVSTNKRKRDDQRELQKETGRGAESQTLARGQLKYYASPVLRTPKQTEKMPQFCPDFHVISKKKKKKVFGLLHTDFSVSFRWALWSQRDPWWAPRSPWAPGSLSPLPPSRRPWRRVKVKKKCSYIHVLWLNGTEEKSWWTNFQQSCCINEITPVHTSLKCI